VIAMDRTREPEAPAETPEGEMPYSPGDPMPIPPDAGAPVIRQPVASPADPGNPSSTPSRDPNTRNLVPLPGSPKNPPFIPPWAKVEWVGMAPQGTCASFLGCIAGPLPGGGNGLAIWLALPPGQSPHGNIEFDTKAWHHEYWTPRACGTWRHTEKLVDGTNIWGCDLRTQSGPTKVRWRTAGNEEWMGPKPGEWNYPDDLAWADYVTPIYAEVRSTAQMRRGNFVRNGEPWTWISGHDLGGIFARYSWGSHPWPLAYRVRLDFWDCPDTAEGFQHCSRHSSRWIDFDPGKSRDGHLTSVFGRGRITDQKVMILIHQHHFPDVSRLDHYLACTVTPHGPTGRRLNDPADTYARGGSLSVMVENLSPREGDSWWRAQTGVSRNAIAFRRHHACGAEDWSQP